MGSAFLFLPGSCYLVSLLRFFSLFAFVLLISLTHSSSSFLCRSMVTIKSKGMWKSVNGFLCILIGNSDAAQNPQDCVPLSISKVKSAESNFRDAFNWGLSFICGGVKGEKETLSDLNMFNFKSVARLSAFVLTLFHRFSFFFFFNKLEL